VARVPGAPSVREGSRGTTGHTGLAAHLMGMDGIALDPGSVAPMVRLAAAGDRTAFARLVAAYNPDLIRVAYVITGGRQDIAEDAVQSAWTIAWHKLRSVREPERLKGWLLTVAVNEARQIMRRQRSRVVEIAVVPDQAGGADPSASIERVDLQLAIRRLPPEDRALLALRYQAGLDSFEIGALRGTTASAVRNHMARVLARLRRDLTDG
jgi:RNA polymerase sigma-70 factor, ECF subfamily